MNMRLIRRLLRPQSLAVIMGSGIFCVSAMNMAMGGSLSTGIEAVVAVAGGVAGGKLLLLAA